MIKKTVLSATRNGKPYGHSFYPVTYKGKEYVVTIEATENNVRDIMPSYSIYSYSPKWALVLGHKRKFVDSNLLEPIILKNGLEVNVLEITDTEFDLNIKEILAGVFEQYERKIADKAAQEAQKQEAADNLHQWDGRLD